MKDQIERLRTATLRHATPVLADQVARLCALLASLLLVSAYSVLPDLRVFGHDEVHYYADQSPRLVEDGRWLNHILHDFLRSIPVTTWAWLFLASLWVLCYRVARALAFDAPYAALVASTTLLAYPFVEQVLWPATAMPAVAVLLGASLLAERGVPHAPIYIGSGILIFGTLQTLYFLLPLFFLGQFLQEAEPAARRWRLFVNHMAWWIGGSIAGVLVMSIMLWLMVGHFGPQPAEWRLTNSTDDWTSLVGNLLYVSRAFVALLEQFLRLGGVTWGFIAIVGLAVLFRARALLAVPQAMLLLAAVLLSFFAFSAPLAPLIHQRSLLAMATAVILFMALFPGRSPIGRLVGAVLLLKMSHGFSVSGEAYLDEHEARTSYFYEKLEELIPGRMTDYSAIALYGTMPAADPQAHIFNDPSQMHPVFIALRARKYLDCRVGDKRCDPVGSGRQLATLPFGYGELRFAVDAAKVGIVRYEPCPAGSHSGAGACGMTGN